MAEIKQWFMSIPIITRYWFGLSIAMPVLGRIGLLNPYHMFMTKDALWRLEVCDDHVTFYSNLISFIFFKYSYGGHLPEHFTIQLVLVLDFII